MATSQKNKDWHPAIISAQLRIKGTSLRKLAAENDLYPTALSVAIQRPWLKAEGIIAQAIGVKPEQIWPSRYLKRTTKKANSVSKRSLEQCSHDCNVSPNQGVRHD